MGRGGGTRVCDRGKFYGGVSGPQGDDEVGEVISVRKVELVYTFMSLVRRSTLTKEITVRCQTKSTPISNPSVHWVVVAYNLWYPYKV